MAYEARLELVVDSTKGKRDVDRFDDSLEKVTRSGNRASAATKSVGDQATKSGRRIRGATREVSRLSRAAAGFVGIAAGIGAGLAVRETVRAADTYANLRSQLRLVTDDQEALNRVYDETFNVAQETRQEFESTVELYARLARSTEALGLSEEQLLTVTRAVNQSFVVSGASAQEASSAILQLSQGLASGTLRGEELNSVLENSPRLARAIADGLGVTIGELRELGAAGRLTGEAVTSALLATADTIDKDFSRIQRTVGQSLQQLRNDVLDALGRTDTTPLVEAVDELRGLVADPSFRQNIVSLTSGAIEAFSSLAGVISNTADELRAIGALDPIDPDSPEKLQELNEEIKFLEDQLNNVPEWNRDLRNFFFNSDTGLKNRIAQLRAEQEVLQNNLLVQAELSDSQKKAASPSIAPPVPSLGGLSDKDREKALKAEAKAFDRLLDAATAYTAERRAAIEADNDAAMQRQEALDEVRASLFTEEQAIEESYNRRIEIVRQNLGLQSELEKQLTREKHEELRQLDQQRLAQASVFAGQQLSILTGALEQAGKEGSNAYKVLFALQKAAAIPSMIVNTEAAATAALAYGGPAGPAIAAAVRGLGYASIGVAAAQTFAGAFDSGGRIPAGQFGLVGERGPELISGPAQVTGRQQTSRMGGGDVVVNVNNAPPGTQVRESEQGGRRVIDVMVADLRNDGPVARAMQSTFGMRRQGS